MPPLMSLAHVSRALILADESRLIEASERASVCPRGSWKPPADTELSAATVSLSNLLGRQDVRTEMPHFSCRNADPPPLPKFAERNLRSVQASVLFYYVSISSASGELRDASRAVLANSVLMTTGPEHGEHGEPGSRRPCVAGQPARAVTIVSRQLNSLCHAFDERGGCPCAALGPLVTPHRNFALHDGGADSTTVAGEDCRCG